MHVLFLAPHFPANQRRFVAGLKAVGARVTGIVDAPLHRVDSEVRGLLDDFIEIGNVTDPDQVIQAVRLAQKKGPWVHHLVSTIESHMMAAAIAREATGIPGLSSKTVELCRDKVAMKAFLGQRGFPVARQQAVDTAEDLARAVQTVGLPLVLKPRAGAGAHSTYKLSTDDDVRRAIAETGIAERPAPFTAEQFLDGHEGFFDTLTVDGTVVFEAVSHYYPNVLPAMRTRDTHAMIVTTNRLDGDGYTELRRFGRDVVKAMGIGTSPTHMEWFFGSEGLKFSEIGARPPGVNFWDQYCEILGVDLYREWARAICWGEAHGLSGPRMAGGVVSLRPPRDGIVRGYQGIDEAQARWGRYIWRATLPPPGSHTQPVEAGYLANAAVWVKHPDYDAAREIMDGIGRLVKIVV
ncbi:MAG: ATPase [Alphaproteobacteria bacterium]|nr:ATPase [Alphaproteobacteria bacterium]